jgi:MFS family permease
VNRALLTVWVGWLAVMAGANLASPLYAVYADDFGFSSLVLTLIFTTYAATLVPSLVLFGSLSDRLGRRPVLLGGMAAACVALLLFAFAGSVGWLFAARAFQGVAVGMISGTATAALVEADDGRNAKLPALLAALAQTVGSGLGPLIAGVLAQWAPAPKQLAYLVVLAATILTAVLTLGVPESVRESHERWRIQRPRVPAEIRTDFARLGVTGGLVWAALALQLSIVPSYASDLLSTRNLALLGALAALALAASTAALLVSQRVSRDRRSLQAVGLVALAAGLLALAAAAPMHSLLLLVAGALVSGAGHGLAFLNTQDELNDIAPASRRGEVTSAFIACIYLGVGAAVISSGLLDEVVSLHAAVDAVAFALAAAALGAAVWQAGERLAPTPVAARPK